MKNKNLIFEIHKLLGNVEEPSDYKKPQRILQPFFPEFLCDISTEECNFYHIYLDKTVYLKTEFPYSNSRLAQP